MKKIKQIEIDVSKCTGCRVCETVCSAFHSEPRYSRTNSKRSRIRISFDETNDLYVPMFAGPYSQVECNGRNSSYTINGEKYGECLFCPVSCPSRDLFKEPDSGLPLKCDMCGEPPPPEGPLCVAWCVDNALTYVEREEEAQKEGETEEEKEMAIDFFVNKYGLQKVMDTVARMSTSKKG